MAKISFEDLDFFKSLKSVALEIQELNKFERVKELEKVIELEKQSRANRFWVKMTKLLLTDSEALEKILLLSEQELNVYNIPNYQNIVFNQMAKN